MKVLFSCLVVLTTVISSVSAQSFSTVYDWMFTNGLTTMTSESAFRPADAVTRGEITKFFVGYAKLKNLSKASTSCTFSDIAGYDSSLTPFITEACEYGLMKGSNGVFRPNANLTEAEAITVISRTLMGMQNENGNPRWEEYYQIGKTYGIIPSSKDVRSLDTRASRSTVGTRLYKAAQLNQNDLDDEGVKEIEQILEEIFGPLS